MNAKAESTTCLPEELKRYVRLAWELGLTAGNSTDEENRGAVAQLVAAKICATAWLWRLGSLISDSTDPKPVWATAECSPLFPVTIKCENIINGGLKSANKNLVTVFVHSDVFDSHRNQWHSITLIALTAPGIVELLQFVKPSSCRPFTDGDRLFVDAVWECVVDKFATTEGELVQMPSKVGLAKRQREVLELLLCGQSAKEIAATLGISCHTVNDYSKSLYRHFGVHSRAELAACFRHRTKSQEFVGS